VGESKAQAAASRAAETPEEPVEAAAAAKS